MNTIHWVLLSLSVGILIGIFAAAQWQTAEEKEAKRRQKQFDLEATIRNLTYTSTGLVNRVDYIEKTVGQLADYHDTQVREQNKKKATK